MKELDQQKIQIMKKDISKTVQERSIFRKILPCFTVTSDYSKEEFTLIGINLLLERNFLQKDEDNKPTFWSWDTLGRMHGADIGRAENNFIIKKIKENVKKEDILKNLNTEDILEKTTFFDNPTIIASNEDRKAFYIDSENFKHHSLVSHDKNDFPKWEGKLGESEVYFSVSLQKGEVIILDGDEFGKILFKHDLVKDYEKRINVIENLDADEINNPDLKNIDLTNKIKLFATEVLTLEIDDKEMALCLKFESN